MNENSNEDKFSVLMSVYFKEKAEFLDVALRSVLIEQTVIPNEIILIKDGKIGKELNEVIDKYQEKFRNVFKIIEFSENKGLGNALKVGVESSRNELIMRMDTDDIAVKDRFEKQINYMKNHKNVSVVGGHIKEFNEDINENMRLKKMPINYADVKKYAKSRNPINHMTACFRKNDILTVGNYQPLPFLEDYYLWIRVLISNLKVENIDETLVYARVGNGFVGRRGSKESLKSWKILQKYMYENHFINLFKKQYNVFRMYILVHVPNWIRAKLYAYFLRKN